MNLSKTSTNTLSIVTMCFLLIACGGGGGGGGNSTPTSSSGVLVPDVRSTGFSSTYSSNAEYKVLVDAFLSEMNDLTINIKSGIKWESDIPVVFSGCGQVNAFFSTGVNLHNHFSSQGVTDPNAVFGNNITGNALVMCHEITEAALTYFFLNPTGINAITTAFNATSIGEKQAAALVSALIFELQILTHELGHGMDGLLLKDSINNAVKTQNFTIPFPNQCNQLGCDTIKEDFADWISAYSFIQLLDKLFKEDPTTASLFVKGWLVALGAWSDILGFGGDVAHGLTEARQINMLCYAYGGLSDLRDADANATPPNGLANILTAKGLDLNDCETTFQRNDASTTKLLSSFIQ